MSIILKTIAKGLNDEFLVYAWEPVPRPTEQQGINIYTRDPWGQCCGTVMLEKCNLVWDCNGKHCSWNIADPKFDIREVISIIEVKYRKKHKHGKR